MTDLIFVVRVINFFILTGHVQFEMSVTFMVKQLGLGYPRRRRAPLYGARRAARWVTHQSDG